MCGIIGIHNIQDHSAVDEIVLRQMLAMLRHRGPDQFGIYRDEMTGLGSARLSIIDLSSGQQPIPNEDESLWIVFNGEIFNYLELRDELEKRGHQFTTTSDTEVILHLYEDEGVQCLAQLNGQFAIAIWDSRRQELFLARDRLGVRPLFYTIADGQFIFGSEIKALLASPAVHAEMRPGALGQIFSYWAVLSPETLFENILEIPPAHYLLIQKQAIRIEAYWQPVFPTEADAENRSLESYLDELRALLIDATRIRLRADVPVGAYLSGGLDSSTIAAIIQKYTSNKLATFSISFADEEFDESPYQAQMLERLNTEHHQVRIHENEIAEIFPQLVWHSETAILRTAPAPMFLLSRLVRQTGYKVVLTGEGADEFLAGYDIFKENQIRRFWAKQVDSSLRPNLLRRLYPFIPAFTNTSQAYLNAFYAQGLNQVDDWDYSHVLRWRTTARAKRFFSAALHEAIGKQEIPSVKIPKDFMCWHPLARAQYLEITVFLSQYLLSSQGDRMGMANSVEGRFPFLDYRVVEFCNRLPPHFKLRGMKEKYLLKELAKELLPEAIWKRPKQAYRAPIHRSFLGEHEYLREMLSRERLQDYGFFEAGMVEKLLQKVQTGSAISETDDMALVGILSTQLVYKQFVQDFRMPAPISDEDNLKICVGRDYAGT